MVSKAQEKLIKSLRLKKYRKKHKAYVIEGPKFIQELIKSGISPKQIFYTDEQSGLGEQFNPNLAMQCSASEFKKISGQTSPSGILAICHLPDHEIPGSLPGLSLYLDGLQDPGNLGTIIRTADWFGVKNIFCSPDNTDAYNPKSLQASMGSIFHVKVHYRELEKIKQEDVEIIAAVPDAEGIAEKNNSKKILIIGNEGNGIRPETLQLSTKKISIPRKGDAESLNAAVAASILMYHYSP